MPVESPRPWMCATFRVIERSEHLGFAFKAHEAIKIRCRPFGQDFEGDLPIQLRVARPIHLAHASGPEAGEDLVRADASSDRKGHARLCCLREPLIVVRWARLRKMNVERRCLRIAQQFSTRANAHSSEGTPRGRRPVCRIGRASRWHRLAKRIGLHDALQAIAVLRATPRRQRAHPRRSQATRMASVLAAITDPSWAEMPLYGETSTMSR
jgi:hypothetical protein